MTLENFRTPLETKLDGTVNLINTFKSADMEFFIMLSSLSGVIGTMGQANYGEQLIFINYLESFVPRKCFIGIVLILDRFREFVSRHSRAKPGAFRDSLPVSGYRSDKKHVCL